MIKIGLIGAGTVGSGVVHIYNNNLEKLKDFAKDDFEIKTVCDLDFSKATADLGKINKSSNWRDLIADTEIKIIVELIGGEEPARTMIATALENKKNVVTANKMVLAKHGKELLEIANKNNVHLLYEAAVGGAIPIIKPLKTTLVPNKIKGIVGIVNGTTNYILTKMTEKEAKYADVLKEAQKLGYAEADPTSDVGGFDSMYKLAVLSQVAFGADVDYKDILVEGITDVSQNDIAYAREMGLIIKLLAIARYENEELELRVHPVALDKNHPLATVNGVYNAIYVEGDAVGDVMFSGRGAGSIPTASSVWADILDIINETPYFTEKLKKIKIKDIAEVQSEYYFRFRLKDKPGVLADISGIFARNNISIKNARQEGLGEDAELVIVSHIVSEKAKNKAIEEIAKLDSVKKVSSIIRVGI